MLLYCLIHFFNHDCKNVLNFFGCDFQIIVILSHAFHNYTYYIYCAVLLRAFLFVLLLLFSYPSDFPQSVLKPKCARRT